MEVNSVSTTLAPELEEVGSKVPLPMEQSHWPEVNTSVVFYNTLGPGETVQPVQRFPHSVRTRIQSPEPKEMPGAVV